jgi:surface protein
MNKLFILLIILILLILFLYYNKTQVTEYFFAPEIVVFTTKARLDAKVLESRTWTVDDAALYNSDNGQTIWDVSTITDFTMLFGATTEATSYDFSQANRINVESWDTSSVTNMSKCFKYAVPRASGFGISDWNVSKVTNFTYMFISSPAATLDIGGWVLKEKTGDAEINCIGMFYNCGQEEPTRTKVELKWTNTSNIANMQNMFSTSHIDMGDLSSWSTANVTDMVGMFQQSKSNHIIDVSTWNVSKCGSFRYMFKSSKIKIKGIENWKIGGTDPTAKMTGMFDGLTAANFVDANGQQGYPNLYRWVAHWEDNGVADSKIDELKTLLEGWGFPIAYSPAEVGKLEIQHQTTTSLPPTTTSLPPTTSSAEQKTNWDHDTEWLGEGDICRGSDKITDVDECETRAGEISVGFKGGVSSLNSPYGCVYATQYNQVRFNTNINGVADDEHRALCAKQEEVSTTTSLPPTTTSLPPTTTSLGPTTTTSLGPAHWKKILFQRNNSGEGGIILDDMDEDKNYFIIKHFENEGTYLSYIKEGDVVEYKKLNKGPIDSKFKFKIDTLNEGQSHIDAFWNNYDDEKEGDYIIYPEANSNVYLTLWEDYLTIQPQIAQDDNNKTKQIFSDN